uniref:Rho-N domain-containing protein 1, chloroplastic n=1 Tax=Noccaea caerulescens TaxID=107243 RepID=A0A1J3GQX6_NOCCA
MSMSGTLHLSSDYFPGYTLSDSRCFSKSAGSKRTLAILPCSSCLDHKIENGRLKCAPNSRSFVCQASSGSYRRNPDFSRLNKHGFRGRNNRPSEERDDFDSEMLSSRNGPLLSLSNSPKFQATCSPGPREKEIVELFRKVQAQLRARAAAKKEDKKIEEASDGQGKESETVDSLLKLLRKHSGEQSKKRVSNFSSQGDDSYPIQGNAVDRRDHSKNLVNSQDKDQNASSFARPTSSFRRNSPVPRSKSPPAYSSQATFDQASSYSVTWTHKKNTLESHEEPEDGPEAEAELEHEYEDEPEYDSEPEPVTAILEPGSELKPESSSFQQEEEGDVTLDALSDDEVTLDVLSDDDETLDEDDDESEEEAAKDEDLSTLKVMELRDIAKSRGLKGFSKMKKAELVELLGSNSS